MEEEWVSPQQSADLCGMAYGTLLRMVRRGELPAEKDPKGVGGAYRLRRADVLAFIDGSKVQPGDLARLNRPRVPRAAPGRDRRGRLTTGTPPPLP